MNAARARRRWLKWCRYVASTGSISARTGFGGTHRAQVQAYWDATHARRWVPNGLRSVWYPRWAAR